MAENNGFDEERVISAVKELFLALNTTPPDEFVEVMKSSILTGQLQSVANELTKEIQRQYIELGKLLKEHIEAAIRRSIPHG